MPTAIYPGSFDPLPNGHVVILERGAATEHRASLRKFLDWREEPRWHPRVDRDAGILGHLTDGNPAGQPAFLRLQG